MPGRIIDLSQPGVRLPAMLAVDTNLVVARLRAPYYPPHIETAERSFRFFTTLRRQGVIGALPTVVCHELFHLAIRGEYQLALPHYRSSLVAGPGVRRRFSWEDLYKQRPDLIDQFLPRFQQLLGLIQTSSLRVIQPEEIAPLPPGQRYQDELVRLVGRYWLNTNDAAILMEAQRAGITAIATLDADLRRAAVDFDVYTWL